MGCTALARGFLFTALAALGGCSSQPLSEPSSEGVPPAGTTADPGETAAPADDYELTEYPAGPYGRNVGSVIENLEFLGWRDPVAAAYDPANFEVLRLSDFYDPEGADVKLIVLNASAVWCGVCQVEYDHIERNDINAIYRAKGV